MTRLLPFVLAAAAPLVAEAAPTVNMAAFAAKLHGQLRGKPGNLFYSPVSVGLALGMTYAGARGETAAELQRVLGLPEGPAAHEGFLALRTRFAELADPPLRGQPPTTADEQRWAEERHAREKIALRVVNRLWGQTGFRFRPEFLKLVERAYGAPLEQLDFKQAEPSRARINGWVARETEQRIKDLIPPGMLSAESRLVLTNAIYFKASWQEPFEPAATREGPFHLSPSKKVTAKLMRQSSHFQIGAIDGGQILELPYGEGALAMDVILPTAHDGLARLEEAFASGALPSWLARLHSAQVDVTLPRFTARSSLELGDLLKAIGIARAFTFGQADFSGMDGSKLLYISKVVHQAFVAVDEKGTEAAAATAVMMAAGGMPPKPVPFVADHPFLFVIRDTQTGAILFAGRLLDPTVR